MTNEPDIEAPLTQEDVRKILKICSPQGLLVGGQALAFWADHLHVARPAPLIDGVTADADFIGDSALAYLLYGVDPAAAVPVEDFRTTSALHKTRWPQILAEIGKKRATTQSLSKRRTRR